MTAAELADYLTARGYDVTRRSHEWWTSCPVHGDPRPSVSWKDGDGGIVLRCKAGCETNDVREAWELSWSDLFAESLPEPSAVATETRSLPSEGDLAKARDRLAGDRETLKRLAGWRGWTDAGTLARLGVGEADSGRVLFPTRDADGRLVGVTEYDPDPRRRGPKSISRGRRDLFPAPEFVKGATLYVVEGEPDAVMANLIGLPAVGVPGAAFWAGARGREAARRLIGRERVCIVGDCDDGGRQWAERAADDCATAGIDARLLELDGNATNGYDLSDLVSDGTPETARRYVERLAANAARVSPKPARESPSTGWPEKMAEEAFIGLTRRIVEAIDPITESDAAALLVQFLAGFGSIVGRKPHMVLDGSRHGCALYVLIVGRSAKSRKGTSWNRVAQILERAARTWHEERVMTGLSSGEGLVWEVRDPVYERVRRDGTRVDDDDGEEVADDDERYVNRVVDPGVEDKRLMVVETEFAQTLRAMRRETNVLSPFIRNLWDRGTAGGLTKHSKTRTRNAHVSIVGHITAEELQREMAAVDLYNGFANRFVYVCAARSKILPGGGALDDVTIDSLAFEVAEAAEQAQKSDRITFDPDAFEIWARAYRGELAVERPGPFGAVTARGEPMVARIAMLYALLDNMGIIRPRHIEAALAVWRYCDASARFLFASPQAPIGDPVAATMLERIPFLPDRIQRGELRRAISHAIKTPRFEKALRELVERGHVITFSERGSTGRAVEWLARTNREG